ncbi:MAG TPA: CinA family protein [Aliidongia sp.]|nr:CinA family protein [Aliidongia sp.]
MIDAEVLAAAEALLALGRAQGLRLGTAESCTGGLIAGALTAIAGSSDVVEAGFMTYSNEAKTAMLGVPADLFPTVGAVSDEVAAAMAVGVLDRLPRIDLAVSVTGIAGPGGGSDAKPVGLVHFGIARRGRPVATVHEVFPGDRAGVRRATVVKALALLTAAMA